MSACMVTRMAKESRMSRWDIAEPQEDLDTTDPETSRLNRLRFWSVLLTDYSVSLGVGRATSLRPEAITQTYPTDEDMQLPAGSTPSSFPHAARLMASYGTLINMLNSDESDSIDSPTLQNNVRTERVAIMKTYRSLPSHMLWSSEKWVNTRLC